MSKHIQARITVLPALLLMFALASMSSCSSGGALVTTLILDQLYGMERSSIYVENAYRKITLHVGDEFQLRVIHRQIREGFGGIGSSRYYYEEDVTEECEYFSSNGQVAAVDQSGLIVALNPGLTTIHIKFDLPLQKADQTSIDVEVVE